MFRRRIAKFSNACWNMFCVRKKCCPYNLKTAIIVVRNTLRMSSSSVTKPGYRLAISSTIATELAYLSNDSGILAHHTSPSSAQHQQYLYRYMYIPSLKMLISLGLPSTIHSHHSFAARLCLDQFAEILCPPPPHMSILLPWHAIYRCRSKLGL